MGQAKLLDCTLRDGAYLVDKRFGDPTIRGIIEGLQRANIDYIEIGFLQDEGFGEGKTVYKNAAEAARFVPRNKKNSKFTVLMDYSRYSIENLEQNPGNSIDAVRACFFKKERYEALEVCQEIKRKGYKVFVQPVDILGYSDAEILELISISNRIEPYCISIVDTFGSMYEEDLQHIYSLMNHNLVSDCKIGFHSHNNMQLSNALSQAFLRFAHEKREVIVDGTLSGMGRGAGNTPIELIAQYMVTKLGYRYDMDALLDIIDGYMDNIRSRCNWGYSTPYFIAGCYSAHVNNITYLTGKNSVQSKDIRYILNRIGAENRKRYHYELLEQAYLEYLQSDIDDTDTIDRLKGELKGKNIVIIAPGRTASENQKRIQNFIREKDATVITVNFLPEKTAVDYMFIGNIKRYNYWKNTEQFNCVNKIITSNILKDSESLEDTLTVCFLKLVKCGWEHLDNSTLMLLRMLDMLEVKSINIAGFDGYSYHQDGGLNYANQDLELSNVKDNPTELNEEISVMLADYIQTRHSKAAISFITESRFSHIVE